MKHEVHLKSLNYSVIRSILIFGLAGFHPALWAQDGFELNFGLSGSWVNSDSPGQGIFLDVNPETGLFWASWFTYQESDPGAGSVIGHADNHWYVALGTFSENSNEVELAIIETAGGAFDNETPVIEAEVGSMTLRFASCSEAVLEFSFNDDGPQGQSELRRLTSTDICQALSVAR